MFVKDYMTRHPVMIDPGVSMVEAQGIMAESRFRHLPVVEKGKRLAGLITRQRLRVSPTDLGSLNVWEITRFLSDLRVEDVMVKRRDVITIDPDAPIEEAAQLMVVNEIGCLPVLEDDVVVGIVTQADMLIQLTTLLGFDTPGTRATMRVPDRQGEAAKVTGAIAEQGWGIWVIGSVPAPKHPGYWDVVVKVRGVSKDELAAVLKQIPEQELVDIRETTYHS